MSYLLVNSSLIIATYNILGCMIYSCCVRAVSFLARPIPIFCAPELHYPLSSRTPREDVHTPLCKATGRNPNSHFCVYPVFPERPHPPNKGRKRGRGTSSFYTEGTADRCVTSTHTCHHLHYSALSPMRKLALASNLRLLVSRLENDQPDSCPIY